MVTIGTGALSQQAMFQMWRRSQEAGTCDGPGPIIVLSEHITAKERVDKVQRAEGMTLDGYSLSNSVVTASEVDAQSAEIESRNNPNKVHKCYSVLSNQFFTKHKQLSAEAEGQRTRKGGSNTWEERKSQWTGKFPSKPMLTREVTEVTDKVKKVESSEPMIFGGLFAGKEQTFPVDSGCTTMVVGREAVERLGLTMRTSKGLREIWK
jgi:hypothetical protein